MIGCLVWTVRFGKDQRVRATALEAGLGLLEVFLYVRDKRIGVQGSRIYVGFRVGGLNIKV